MIQEIQNFIEHISQSDKAVFTHNLKLKEGIYILLDIEKNKDNYILLNEKEIYDVQEDLIINDGKNEILQQDKLLAIALNTIPASYQKILNPLKKIFNLTCSPFALGFNKKNYNNKSAKILISAIAEYFKGAEKYIENENTQHQIWFHNFKGFCLDWLVSFMESLPTYKDAKTNTNIYLFLKKPIIDDYLQTHQAYLSDKVFNKDEFNIKVNDETYGISDSMSGFNVKKMFLKHYTAPLEYNYRVSGKVAMQLWRFFQLQQNKQIPNPVPIFIDQMELNDKMISIFNAEKEQKMGHAEIIRSILNHNKKDLQNFYLIYFQGTKGSRIADIDFISLFKYEEKDAKLIEIFPLGGSQSKNRIENVFDLENLVFNKIFNGQLKVNNWLKYFDEIKFDKYFTNTSYNQLLKYRKSIYDFIYKSERHSINARMFDDMMSQTILDDIRNDEEGDNKHFTKNEGSIKEKLNIWFSLYSFFIPTNSKNRINMVNQTQELRIKMKELISWENDSHLDDDIAFAFATGQIIHYLLSKSEASKPTHALLEPFLQKADANQLKLAIARTFDTYKHAIFFYKIKFDKLMSEVMGYVPDEKNMKNLLPFILAGYFSKSVFSKDNTKTETDN
jgi:CRISPR-associated protein Csh1